MNKSDFIYPVNVRFNDIDVFGHVNNALYLSYFEEARMTFFNEVLGLKHDWIKQGLILARAVVEYKSPLLLNETALIKVHCSNVGNKSFTLSYSIYNSENKKIYCTGETTIVMFDYSVKQSIPVIDAIRKLKID